MTKTYKINGMTCQSCVKRVQAALAPLAQSVDFRLNPPQAVLHNATGGLAQMQQALAGSHYSIHEMIDQDIDHCTSSETKQEFVQHSSASAYASTSTSTSKSIAINIASENAVNAATPIDNSAAFRTLVEKETESTPSWFTTYQPLLLIWLYVLAVSVLLQVSQSSWAGVNAHETMRYFMAGFFLVFSFFKLLDLPAFADAYAGYDLLAKKWRGWGSVYPFVELLLGLAYLTHWQPLFTNWVTIIVMGFSAIGVIQAVLDKRRIRYACLGTVFKLPMSTVTIIEDVGMVLMAGMAIYVLR